MASGYILMHCDQNGVIFHILSQNCSYLDVNFDILDINIKVLKKCDWFHSINIYKWHIQIHPSEFNTFNNNIDEI